MRLIWSDIDFQVLATPHADVSMMPKTYRELERPESCQEVYDKEHVGKVYVLEAISEPG